MLGGPPGDRQKLTSLGNVVRSDGPSTTWLESLTRWPNASAP